MHTGCQRLTPHISGIGSGWLPTPTADACISSAPTFAMAERFRRKGSSGSFIEAIAAKVLWPTPTASRWSGLQSHGKNAILGLLNPRWVEWLMGFPPGWCDLSSNPSETPSSRKSLK